MVVYDDCLVGLRTGRTSSLQLIVLLGSVCVPRRAEIGLSDDFEGIGGATIGKLPLCGFSGEGLSAALEAVAGSVLKLPLQPYPQPLSYQRPRLFGRSMGVLGVPDLVCFFGVCTPSPKISD